MSKLKVYAAIIEEIFVSKYVSGMTRVDFERSDIVTAAERRGVQRPSNVGDVVYSFRYRGLPQNLWAERRTGSPSSDPQRARVLARPRCVGLTAWTPAPRTRARPLVVLLERGVGGLRPVRGAPG